MCIEAGRQRQQPPQMIGIVLVGQRWILVEPFRRKQLSGRAPLRPPAGQLDARPYKHCGASRNMTTPSEMACADAPFVRRTAPPEREIEARPSRHPRRPAAEAIELLGDKTAISVGDALFQGVGEFVDDRTGSPPG
jgi:hypothetical protein